MLSASLPQGHASLQFFNGPLSSSKLVIDKQFTVIGSAENENDIVLHDSSIQPHHARIYIDQGEYFIQANTTAQAVVSINQMPISRPTRLTDGDNVALGVPGIIFLWIAPQEMEHSTAPRQVFAPSSNSPAPQQSLLTPIQMSPLSSPNTPVSQSFPLTPVQASPLPMQNAAPHLSPVALETTRYLCAAAHLDEDFREYAINNVFEEEHKAVGESFGVDILSIAKWCYAARKRTFYRDLFLCIDFLLLFFFHSGIGYSLLGPLFFFAQFSSGLSFALQLLLFIATLIQILFVVGIVLLIERTFRFARQPLFLIGVLILLLFANPFFVLCFLLAWLILTVEQVMNHGARAKPLAKGRFKPDGDNGPLEPQLERKLRDIFYTQGGNVIVYSGYSPFAGSGVTIDGWSFTIDISKGKKELASTTVGTPEAFHISELYAEIVQRIQKLNLNNVSVEDKLYVNGQAIRDDAVFLPDKFSYPRTQIDNVLMNQFKENPQEHIRYYTCIRVISWDGELVLSTFVRFKRAGKNLFVEVDYELLAPVKGQYHEIDTIEPTLSTSKLLIFASRTFSSALFDWFRSPVRVVKYLLHDWLLARRRTRVETSIRENPAFDYGTQTSLREVASSSRYRLYFQRLDKEMYKKIIERELLETITDFLDDKSIDTADLKSRQETILNNGVIMTGNAIQGSNIAFGEAAKQTILANPNTASRGATEKKA